MRAAAAAATVVGPELVENHTFDEIAVGDTARLSRTLKASDIALFAAMSGDANPAHVDPQYAAHTRFHGVVAHGMWGAALISTVLGTDYPGAGTVYLGQTLRFQRPVHIGDTLDVRLTVTARDPSNRQVAFDCRCTNQKGEDTIVGSALVLAPTEKLRLARRPAMAVRLFDSLLRYRQLLARTATLPAIAVAVVHPCDEESLRGALDAAQIGLIVPVLVGPERKIRAVALAAGIDIAPFRLMDAPHSHAAAALAVGLAHRGEVRALMKGSLHTDELMHEVVREVDGLRTGRRISHVYVLDVPAYPKPLLISDGAMNLTPDLAAKRDIVQNAIDLAHALGIGRPKVAILAAVETVNPAMPSTVDAAALCKMAERGQITGAVLDGPLAFDNAISAVAAARKGIESPVAGQPDILIAPDLEAGNMLAKQLQYLADAQAGGLVMGARVPIILTSRADGAIARVASCALALLVSQAAAAPVQPA